MTLDLEGRHRKKALGVRYEWMLLYGLDVEEVNDCVRYSDVGGLDLAKELRDMADVRRMRARGLLRNFSAVR